MELENSSHGKQRGLLVTKNGVGDGRVGAMGDFVEITQTTGVPSHWSFWASSKTVPKLEMVAWSAFCQRKGRDFRQGVREIPAHQLFIISPGENRQGHPRGGGNVLGFAFKSLL